MLLRGILDSPDITIGMAKNDSPDNYFPSRLLLHPRFLTYLAHRLEELGSEDQAFFWGIRFRPQNSRLKARNRKVLA